MYQHEWLQKLKKLNPRLRVCQFDASAHLPGVYYVDDREGIVDVCATDKGFVPACAEFDAEGHIIKSGYRRVTFILLHLKLTTPECVRRVFPGFFESHYPIPAPTKVRSRSVHQQWAEMMKEERKKQEILGDAQQVEVQDVVTDKMKQMELDNHYRRGSAALSGDQFIELAADLREKASDDILRNLDEAKFDYDKAVGKRKVLI